ncbi:hypothetical protein BFP46_24860 [Bacillus licheniformis]|jgi:uncharacterized membrane protein YadS|nr:hypothetical protein BFP47_23500 [Bacillus licheniformis]OJT66449.1 hypothetical protein BFP46_24860 [Bacillus licheniformis]
MSTNNISTPMFIIAFFLFVVGILTIFNVINDTLSTILFVSLFLISILMKAIELSKKKSNK